MFIQLCPRCSAEMLAQGSQWACYKCAKIDPTHQYSPSGQFKDVVILPRIIENPLKSKNTMQSIARFFGRT